MEPQISDFYNEEPHMMKMIETMNDELSESQKENLILKKKIQLLEDNICGRPLVEKTIITVEEISKYALIELQGILSGSKSYGQESLRLIERLPKSSTGFKVKKKYFFRKDNSWKEEIDEFAKIIFNNLTIKTGNVYDALQVMIMVEKVYHADKEWRL